jgi:hypothetical protein
MFLSSFFFGISGPKFSKIFRNLKFVGAIESQAGAFSKDVTGSCRRTLRGFFESRPILAYTAAAIWHFLGSVDYLNRLRRLWSIAPTPVDRAFRQS